LPDASPNAAVKARIATHTVKGDAEANQLLARLDRAPWVHPDPKNV
jgi:uncharacterized Fe-S cluster protein YjdI